MEKRKGQIVKMKDQQKADHLESPVLDMKKELKKDCITFPNKLAEETTKRSQKDRAG